MELIKFVHKKEEEVKNPTLYKTYKYLKDIKKKIHKKKINKIKQNLLNIIIINFG